MEIEYHASSPDFFWLGAAQPNAAYHLILSIYNLYKPLFFVSLQLDSIIPPRG